MYPSNCAAVLQCLETLPVKPLVSPDVNPVCCKSCVQNLK